MLPQTRRRRTQASPRTRQAQTSASCSLRKASSPAESRDSFLICRHAQVWQVVTFILLGASIYPMHDSRVLSKPTSQEADLQKLQLQHPLKEASRLPSTRRPTVNGNLTWALAPPGQHGFARVTRAQQAVQLRAHIHPFTHQMFTACQPGANTMLLAREALPGPQGRGLL